MTRLVVECGFGSTVSTALASITWTDITEFVDVRNSSVVINRGASDEVSDIQPGTCTLTLDNSDGRFSPGLASSPYHPNVKKDTPLRVRVITTAKNLMPNPSFESGVTDWVSSGTPTRVVSTTHVQHGAQAMLITWGAVASQTVTSPTICGLQIGQQYTFSAYVWVPAGDAPVQLSLAGGAIGSQSTINDAFQRITVTFTATSTSHQVRVRAVGTPAAGDVVWVDSCQIEDGAAATTFDPVAPRDHHRFWGMVNDWPTKWQGLYATATITCTDLFKRLNRQPNLRSCLAEEILLDAPIAYYPLTEPSDSISGGDLSGVTAGPLGITQALTGGTLQFASADGPAAAGDQVPTFTPASSSAGKYLTANLGPTFESRSSTEWHHFECWFSTSTVSRVIFALTSTDEEKQLIFALDASGVLQIEYALWGPPVTIVGTTSGNLANGVMHHLVYDEQAQDVWIDGVLVAVGTVELMYRLRNLSVGGYSNGRLWAGSISHLAIYTTPSASLGAALAAHYTSGTTAHSGEDGDARIQRLASYAGVSSVTVTGVVHDPVAGQGQGGSTALARMKEVEQTEAAKLIAQRNGYGLAYQGRDVRYNPDPLSEVFTVSYADLVTGDVEISDDDQKQVNTIVASRPGGATQRILNQASRDTYGTIERELSILKTSDLAVLDAANWTISRYADPPPELRQVAVEAYTLAAYPNILDGDVSSYFSVTGLPAQAPSSTLRVTIEGYTETIRHASHVIQFHTSRSATDSVWVLDDATYSVLDSTTRLAY
ncbi:phage head spike fiber domain-containing protein [Streptomyces sp. SYSU K21746]